MTTHKLPDNLPVAVRVEIAQRLTDMGGIVTADEYLAVLSRGEVSDAVLTRARTPPDACWLCSRPLGTHPDCLMCDAYRKDASPTPLPPQSTTEEA